MKFSFLRRVRREAARNKNDGFVPGEGKKEATRNRNGVFVPEESKKGGRQRTGGCICPERGGVRVKTRTSRSQPTVRLKTRTAADWRLHLPGTGRRPREDAHQQIAADGPTAALPGTEMTVLFPGRMDKRQMGAKREILIPMTGRS